MVFISPLESHVNYIDDKWKAQKFSILISNDPRAKTRTVLKSARKMDSESNRAECGCGSWSKLSLSNVH